MFIRNTLLSIILFWVWIETLSLSKTPFATGQALTTKNHLSMPEVQLTMEFAHLLPPEFVTQVLANNISLASSIRSYLLWYMQEATRNDLVDMKNAGHAMAQLAHDHMDHLGYPSIFEKNPSLVNEFCDNFLNDGPVTDNSVEQTNIQSSSLLKYGPSLVDLPPKMLWNKVPRIAVCLVGAPRTLITRTDQVKGLKYQFLAALGSKHDVFAVLSKPANTTECQAANETLQQLGVRGFEWYNDSFLMETLCSVVSRGAGSNREATQFRLWLQSFKMMEQYEKENSFKYITCIKLRPDTLWYGPMYPHCALRPDTAYLYRQLTRYSDQWFMVPRRVAGEVFNMIFRMNQHGILSCHNVNGAHKLMLNNGTQFYHFEVSFYETFVEILKENDINLIWLTLPNILSRDSTNKHKDYNKDAKVKCNKFLWGLPTGQCVELVTYQDVLL